MDVQRWILQHALTASQHHHASWAYRKGRSILGCASQHVGARWLVKMDLHDFFGAIDERAVTKVFANIGYSPLLSFEMGRICTRATASSKGERVGGAPYLRRPLGVLPQGAPTSGALANAVMYDVDKSLSDLAHEQQLVYTRYSDDIVFSHGGQWDRAGAAALVRAVSRLLRGAGYQVHRRKTIVVPPGSRKIVLGLLVLSDRVLLQREFKQRIKFHLRGVQRYGLMEHAEHRSFRSMLLMVEHIEGLIAFAHSVEPAFAAIAATEWEQVLSANSYPSL